MNVSESRLAFAFPDDDHAIEIAIRKSLACIPRRELACELDEVLAIAHIVQ
jgi:hypothetical protein